MDVAPVAPIAIIGTAFGALVSYLAVVRRLSGKIATSSAQELWDEARDIRKDYSTQINDLNARLLAITQQNTELQVQVRELRDDYETCSQSLEECHRKVSELEKGGR